MTEEKKTKKRTTGSTSKKKSTTTKKKTTSDKKNTNITEPVAQESNQSMASFADFFSIDEDDTIQSIPAVEETMELVPQSDEIAGVDLKTDPQKQGTMATKKQGQKKTTRARVKKVKKDKLGFNWFFWISFILICIPVGYFLYLLYQASLESRTPVVGTRIETEIQDYIPSNATEVLHNSISALDNVESCEVNLIVETMRITINAKDSLNAEELKLLNEEVYKMVDELLPIETYFTQHYDYKQYDLEITSYNNLESETMAIVTLVKNSKMTAYSNEDLTSPRNPQVAEELRKELEEKERQKENPDEGSTNPELEPGNLVIEEIRENINILNGNNE